MLFIFFIFVFLLLFCYISFKKIQHNYPKLINFMMYHMKFNNHYQERFIINNLDYLLPSYTFNNPKKIIINNKKILLYSSNQKDNNLNQTLSSLKNNLNKIGIVADIKNDITNNYDYYINITLDSSNNRVTIGNKKYAKISFGFNANNKEMIEKMHHYLNEYYPGLSKGIIKDDDNEEMPIIFIKIGNNMDAINNSTEALALMLDTILH